MFSNMNPEPINSAYEHKSLERSTLGYATNNVHPSLPPRMDDSRSLIASYQPEAVLNETLLKNSNVKSNWEYRRYLTNNSEKIARENFQEACNDVGYFQRFTPEERGDDSQTFSSPSNHLQYKHPNTILNEKSDLKELYLSKEELQKRKDPVTITQDRLFSNLTN